MSFRDQIADPIILEAYDWWSAKRVDGSPPGRADIDPIEVPRLLRWFLLSDIETGPPFRIRYRLVGTSIVEMWGNDFTGRYVDEIMSGDYRDFITGLFQDAVSTGRAVYSESRFRWDVGRQSWTRRVTMPLFEADGGIKVLSCQTFGSDRPTGPQAPTMSEVPNHELVVRIIEPANETR